MTRFSSSKGFTLIELLVSLSIFVIIMLAATSAYLSFISYNRQAQTTSTVVNSVSFSIDNMARDMRTGTDYTYINQSDLQFTNANGCLVEYKLDSGAIKKAVLSGTGCTTSIASPITDTDVIISSLRFYTRGTSPGPSDGQPMVTIVIGGYACVPNTDCTGTGKVMFQIETGATQRLPDL